MTDQEFMENGPKVVRDFLEYHQFIRGHSAMTVKAYSRDIRLFIAWLHRSDHLPPEQFDETIAAAVRKSDVYEYLKYLGKELGNSPRTQKRVLSAIKSLFYYLCEVRETVPRVGIDRIEPPLVRADSLDKFRHKSLELEDAVDLQRVSLGRYDLRDRAIVSVFLCTGIRLSEMAGLNLDSIDLRTGKMTVLGKGGKIRELFLDPDTLAEVKAYYQDRIQLHPRAGHEQAFFLSQFGSRISNRRIESMLDERLKAAGLENRSFHPHSLRHTAATLMLRSNADIKTVSEALGHADTAITGTYLHSNEQLIRQASERVSEAVRGKSAGRQKKDES